MNRAVRLAAQLSLLLVLLSTCVYLILRTYLADEETIHKEGHVSEIHEHGGPVTIGDIEWKLESLQPYQHLVDKEGKKAEVDQPAGAVLMVAILSVTPREGTKVDDDGFNCDAKLRDDKGNVWDDTGVYSYSLPTYCGDNDTKWALDKTSKVAKIFVIPGKLAPGVLGIEVESLRERRRALITP